MRNVKQWAPLALIAVAVVVALGLALATMAVGGNATPGWLMVAALVAGAAWMARRPRKPLPPTIQEQAAADLAARGVVARVAGEEAPAQELPPVPVPADPKEAASTEAPVTKALRHWISQLPSVIVAVGSVFALAVIRLNQDNGTIGWAIAILTMVGFAIIVLRPYFAAAEKVGEAYRRLRAIKRATIVWTGIGLSCLVAAVGLWWYQAQITVDLGWLWSSIVWLGERLWWLAQTIFQSPTSVMVVVAGLAFLKMVFSLAVWASNPIIFTETSITAVSGIFRKEEPKVDFHQITDLTPVFPFKVKRVQLPWCTLKVETPGQNQGFDEIAWFPTKYLPLVKT